MATAKQRAWRAKFARMYGGGRKKAKRRSGGGKMARRGRGRRSNGGGMGMSGILSSKNIIGTLGGAYVAPMIGVSPQIGAAAGSYMIGKKGLVGAAVGYFAAPIVLGMIGGLGSNKASSSQVLY